MTVAELQTKWSKEAKSYTKLEVGSGVQKFVKDALKSPDLFNLAEGLASTKLEDRKNEFVEESPTKAARKADVVIYVNPDIVVPMEVERYGNIKAGLTQLRNYQLDLEKKYGILTDGFTWQFYNNDYLLKEFTLDEMLAKADLFNDFWQEYIKPEFYYLSFFEEVGQQKLFPEDLSVEARRQNFFKDITTLIRSFKNKLDIEGYFKSLGIKEKEKRAVEITYAYIIQFILYKTLVDNDFGDFKKKFIEKNEAIYKCLKQKQYGKILGIIDEISSNISKNIYRPFAKEQEFISQTVLDLFHSSKNELHDVSPWLDIFIFIRKYSFANVRNEIFGYIYENYLKELYEETQKGQYFTDPAVVNFMLDQIGYDKVNIEKRLPHNPEGEHISLIDPSCGSGTFLYSATDRLIQAVPNGSEESSRKIEELVNNNIFGLDIGEFPLYLAEMNILMRMLPLIINEKYNNPVDKKIKVFLTKDSIAEFTDTGLKNTLNDIDVAAGQQALLAEKLDLGYKSYVRDEGDLEEMKASMRPPRRRFDYVIGNPPYISYNESSKQNLLIIKLIQNKKVLMSDIYGVNLNTVPERKKPYSPKPNLYSFFIALGLGLLKDNGKLCYIIPQTILTASDLDVLRYHLAKYTTIEKIIVFSGKMFVGRGLKQNKPVATSSLIFVTKKRLPSILNQIEIIYYKNSLDEVSICLENISKGRKITRKKIKQNDLLSNLGNWSFIKEDKLILDFYKEYKDNTDDILWYRQKLVNDDADFSFDGGVLINQDDIEKQNFDSFEIFDYKRNNWDRFIVNSIEGFYPKSGEFKFPGGSQGIGTYLKKYKIIWRTRFSKNFQFSDKSLLLINNQSLVVSSNSKNELLFYFSLLNSNLNKFILDRNLRQENERNFFVSLKAVKSLIRVPKLTENNNFIKEKIVNKAEEMLRLEEVKLFDFVDFSKIMIQKFDKVSVQNAYLILEHDKKQIKLAIINNPELVEKTISKNYYGKGLKFERQMINLSELRNLPVIDFEKQQELKNYIDDLVFAMYFNVPLEKSEANKPEIVKYKCAKNNFYQIISPN